MQTKTSGAQQTTFDGNSFLRIAQPGRHTVHVQKVRYHGTPISCGTLTTLNKARRVLHDRDCIQFEFRRFIVMLRLTHKDVQRRRRFSRSPNLVKWSWEQEGDSRQYNIYLQVGDEAEVKVLEFQLEVATSAVQAFPMKSEGRFRRIGRGNKGVLMAVGQKFRCELSKLTFANLALKTPLAKHVEDVLMYATAKSKPGEVYVVSKQGIDGRWYSRKALGAIEDIYRGD